VEKDLVARGGCAVPGLGKKDGCDIGKVKNDLRVLKYELRKFGIFHVCRATTSLHRVKWMIRGDLAYQVHPSTSFL